MLITLSLTAITLLLLWIGAYHLREVYFMNRCLDEEILRKYLYKRIDNPRDYEHVITHLNSCSRCQDLLRDIQEGKPIEDHLVDKAH